MYDWGAFPVSAATPCFDALALGDLVITGVNWGSGVSPQNVTLKGTLSCKPGSRQSFASADADSIQCSLTDTLPRGPAPLALGIAYSTASSEAAGIVPRAECPCGYYSEADGVECAVCPAGGICPGASLSAVAQAGYWRTNASEWITQRFIDPSASGGVIPLFVSCPTASLCLAGQQCVAGSGSWACASCQPGYARGGVGTACFKCGGLGDLTSLVIVMVIAAALVGGAAGAAVYFFRRRRAARAAAAAAASTKTAIKDAKDVKLANAPNSDDVFSVAGSEQQGISTFLKIFFSFVQTVSSLTSYTSSSTSTRTSDSNIVPGFIASTAIFSDLGSSIQQIQCAGQVTFELKTLLYAAAPIAAFVVVPPVVRVIFTITAALKVYGVGLTSSDIWGRAFFLASVVLFLIIAPTIGALARAQLWWAGWREHRDILLGGVDGTPARCPLPCCPPLIAAHPSRKGTT